MCVLECAMYSVCIVFRDKGVCDDDVHAMCVYV